MSNEELPGNEVAIPAAQELGLSQLDEGVLYLDLPLSPEDFKAAASAGFRSYLYERLGRSVTHTPAIPGVETGSEGQALASVQPDTDPVELGRQRVAGVVSELSAKDPGFKRLMARFRYEGEHDPDGNGGVYIILGTADDEANGRIR